MKEGMKNLENPQIKSYFLLLPKKIRGIQKVFLDKEGENAFELFPNFLLCFF